MSSTLSTEIVPTLKVISKATAEKLGYRPLTVGINPNKEPRLFRSIQRDLAGTNSVWINNETSFFVAARHESELRKIEPEPLEIEMLIPDYERGAIQARSEREVSKVLQILDEIQVESLRVKNYEEKGADQ